MKRILSALMATIIVGFTLFTVHTVETNNQQLRLKEIKLRNIQTELEDLDSEYQRLQDDHTKTQQEKDAEIEKLKTREQELEKQLQAKLDAKRLLSQQTAVAHAEAISTPSTGCMKVREALSNHGISGSELDAAVELARLESGCNQYARNRSSGACNVFQEYPCGKWGGTADLNAHIKGAIGYARASYGTFNNALSTWHSRSPHWW